MPSLRVNGTDMTFVERGTGAPLVLVHGTLGDCRSWALQMEPFGAHYRTIAVSLRHCWPERWDGEGDDFTVQQHTKDVAAFIAALDAGPVHLMGHSRGGHIAFRVAQDFPCLVRKLVLVEPGGALDASLEPPQAPAGPPIALGPLYAEAAARIRRGEVDEGLAPAIDVIHGPGGWAKLPEEKKQQMRDNALTLLGQIRESRAPFSRADAEAILRRPCSSPASARRKASTASSTRLESALKDVRRVVIPDASHGSNIDNPKRFAREALAFLKHP